MEAKRIVPEPWVPDPQDVESFDVWGFRDTAFQLRDDGAVVLTGSRYPLCGEEMAELLGWVHDTIHPAVRPDDRHPSRYPPEIPAARSHPAFEDEMAKVLGDDPISRDPEVRLRHGHGHTQEEMYAIKYGRIERVPDLVVFPTEHEQVVALVEAALRHDVCLVPYGGGNQRHRCAALPDERVAHDRLRRPLAHEPHPVDRPREPDGLHRGRGGRKTARPEQLAAYGFTLGHEPDSVEFSTLGGWIATHASGMKKNRYGNIEQIVLDVTAVTARGVLERSATVPRESVGIADARRWIFGSEGGLGIVTRAVVKLFPLPEKQVYGSIVFRDFESGFHFLRDLEREGTPPASVRLVDNMQFQLSQMLKGKRTGWKAWKSKLEKALVVGLKGFDPETMCACTLVYEGSAEEVRAQQRHVRRLASRHGGLAGGAENGRRGYQLTFGIAYIRDWIMNHWMLAESFETSVPWSQALELCERVKQRIRDEHRERGLPGKPLHHLSHHPALRHGRRRLLLFRHVLQGCREPEPRLRPDRACGARRGAALRGFPLASPWHRQDSPAVPRPDPIRRHARVGTPA